LRLFFGCLELCQVLFLRRQLMGLLDSLLFKLQIFGLCGVLLFVETFQNLCSLLDDRQCLFQFSNLDFCRFILRIGGFLGADQGRLSGFDLQPPLLEQFVEVRRVCLVICNID
jgi:hypothetical protein